MTAARQSGSKLKTGLLILMIPVGFLLAINLFWFAYSTTRIHIAGPGLANVKLWVNDELIDLGSLRRGESRFMFLPKHGTAVYSITFMEDDNERVACTVEVGETGHHVEASLRPGDGSTCSVEEPMFSGLMVGKFF